MAKSDRAPSMLYADIAIGAPTHSSFTYEVPPELSSEISKGARVVVPFRRRKVVGYVLNLSDCLPPDLKGVELKSVESILDIEPVFSEKMLSWLKWIADYYFAPIGEVCRSALPSRLNKLSPPKTSRPTLPREMEHLKTIEQIVLSKDQKDVLKKLKEGIAERNVKPFLLHGITGSGKTEVYLKLFETVREKGRQAILLVPEIGLTPQLASRIIGRFGEATALYHSGLTDAQRHHQWERMRSGEVSVVVGTRSALFAPLPNLGAIVVDEEHDTSYKQDEGVLYNARDAAVMRAKFEDALVIFGSATPSMETFANAASKKYNYFHMPERTGGGSLPEVKIVDMRHESARELAAGKKKQHERSSLSQELIKEISATLERREQCMIFLNRRGFAHFLICEECGHTFECPNCDISLAYHKNPAKLICHYCDYWIAPPKTCPACRGIEIVPMGRGTEKIEMEIGRLFPKAKIERLDRDTVTKSSKRASVFGKMKRGEIDILIGTQMIAKGHDFPNITLVGIINADVALHMPDFRSAERTFQLITQVSGRAGRSGSGAKVILQTYQPENSSLVHACSHDYFAFYNEEKSHRTSLGYPPFMRLANLRISATDRKKIAAKSYFLSNFLKNILKEECLEKDIMLLGPAPAPMEKVRGRYRWHLLVKAGSSRTMSKFLKKALPKLNEERLAGLKISIDVDPINML